MIRFDSSHIILGAADPLRFDPPVRDLLWNIAADPSRYETIEISHAVHRLGGDAGFERYLSKVLDRLTGEAERQEETTGARFILQKAKMEFDRGSIPVADVVEQVEAAAPRGFRRILLESVEDWTRRRPRNAVLRPDEYFNENTIHWLLEGDREGLERQLKQMELIQPDGSIEEMPDWDPTMPAPEIRVRNAMPGAGRTTGGG